MNLNQNSQNNDNGQWDKWNSNASHSSYYNQPTHRPYGQGFLIASGVCGLLSVTTCSAVILSIPLGALGILFAVLTYRKGKKINSACLIGLVSSCMGLLAAMIMIIYSFVMLPVMLENEAFRNQFNTITQQLYGMDFVELIEQYYGHSIE